MSTHQKRYHEFNEAHTVRLLPEEKLANAIILQAVVDYRLALAALKRRVRVESSMRTRYECEDFFRSDIFGMLSSLDGEAIIHHIQSRINDAGKDAKNAKPTERP